MAVTTPDGTEDPAPYAPVAWNGTFPLPTSIFASAYAADNTPAEQYAEAAKLNKMITDQNHDVFNTLHSIPSPIAMLVQVSGTCNLRIIFGIAKYIMNPLAPDNGLNGTYLAIGEDLRGPGESARAVELPEDILKTNMVKMPTDAAFVATLTAKATTQTNVELDRTQWFKTSTATTQAQVAKAVPVPLCLAFDACRRDLTAQVIFERCAVELEAHSANADSTLLLRTIMNFCKAAHTTHNKGTETTALPLQQLSLRLHDDAHVWAQARAAQICPHLGQSTPLHENSPSRNDPGQTDFAASLVTKVLDHLKHGNTNLFNNTSEKGEEKKEDKEDTLYKTYGARGEDLQRYLRQCGKEEGQEEELPAWKKRMAAKNLSDDGKDQIAREMLEMTVYEDHRVLPHPTILKMIMKCKFSGDTSHTAAAVMTGLSPYLLVELTEEEVHRAQETATSIKLASSTTPADIKKLTSRKAKVPTSFTELMDTLKKFANLLFALFGAECPLLSQITQLISGMMRMETAAKGALDGKSIAAIMWVIYKQARRFTSGKVTRLDDTDLNWLDLKQKLFTAASIHRNDIPLGIHGVALPPVPETIKRKPDGEPPTFDYPHQQPAPPPTQERDIRKRYTVHHRVASQIVAKLPFKFSLRNALEKRRISKDIFGVKNMCLQAALYGKCTNRGCTKVHDMTKITDAAVDKAIAHLSPIFNAIAQEGKND